MENKRFEIRSLFNNKVYFIYDALNDVSIQTSDSEIDLRFSCMALNQLDAEIQRLEQEVKALKRFTKELTNE